MKTFFLSIGSNIDPRKNVPACLELLKQRFRVLKISPVYETTPVGPAGNRNFWNLAVELETNLNREDLRTELRKIEKSLGRARSQSNKFMPRTIDIDILPSRGYKNQAFIMVPLVDIAPRRKDPKSGKTFSALAKKLISQTVAWKRVRHSEILS
ncbi:MAG TPA: 2-amino-4-hydroxy-6-hydroxymethyldihydropteridine diphosphokinase [bacterium]|nr:2-amino-4-hydroxy-6-hydroxymethyldihydropteridine diphosphokinase [bacterium]